MCLSYSWNICVYKGVCVRVFARAQTHAICALLWLWVCTEVCVNNCCMRRVLAFFCFWSPPPPHPAQQSGRIKIKQIYRIQVFASRKKKKREGAGCLVLLGEVMVCDGESKKKRGGKKSNKRTRGRIKGWERWGENHNRWRDQEGREWQASGCVCVCMFCAPGLTRRREGCTG